MTRALLIAAALFALCSLSQAQMMMMNFGRGGQSGVPAVACTNQLVLDYSNSCALIGQGFGQ